MAITTLPYRAVPRLRVLRSTVELQVAVVAGQTICDEHFLVGRTREPLDTEIQDKAISPGQQGKTMFSNVPGQLDEIKPSARENRTESLISLAVQDSAILPDREDRAVPSDATRLSHNDRIIVLMGPMGVGKSTFIDYATRQNGASIGHALSSQTTEIRTVRYMHPEDNHPVIFVDTPGFDDTLKSDIEILCEIATWFVKALAGSPLKNLNMFANMCGQESMPRVVLGTTMWTEVVTATGERRENELEKTFWADMITQGCRMVRFGDSYESAWDMIGTLATQGYALASETVDGKKRSKEIAAGLNLNQELEKLIAEQREAVRQLEQRVVQYDNPVLVEELQKRKTEIEKKLAGVAEQLQRLRIPWRRKLTNWFTGGKKARASNIRIGGPP
ncbi:hypothetical protein HWV62_23274 [Athelia sp. TMB]|nr:hypothetical protein HWV62_23274 [Athelia sp. TMB]